MMNYAGASLLQLQPETRTWYRVVASNYLHQATQASHTLSVPTRFYDPNSAFPQFGILYLASHPTVAQYEANALLGSPYEGAEESVPVIRADWVVLTVTVQLSQIANVSTLGSQACMHSSAQELTGDWLGYSKRSSKSQVKEPTGTAPTQLLGEAIHRDLREIEGFIYLSAKVPRSQNLAVFPDHLRDDSYIQYMWSDRYGQRRYRVDRRHPDGVEA